MTNKKVQNGIINFKHFHAFFNKSLIISICIEKITKENQS